LTQQRDHPLVGVHLAGERQLFFDDDAEPFFGQAFEEEH